MKSKHIESVKKFWKYEKIYKFEWVVLAIVSFVAFFSYCYGNIITTAGHCIGVWNLYLMVV